MSHQPGSRGFDLDAAFKTFGAVGIAISAALIVAVLALTDPFGEYVTASPALLGTLLYGALVVAVGYTTYALRRG
ncbi:hypothetical protein PN416_07160 [Halorubrum ezzemoulense]|uniref:hypothetical protein n=1 Tax=Halorubrum ezzemoulense TaxID=337243 RepID=UPI002330120C|nr:hypothetical protein [Halorubrum ezzemoulense]MDB9279828.1 hypothetical protein [Halorubrum ezzemoulense]MDB9283217.1 hypothetical protein [Halorubrum ezzemoulense]